MFHARSSETKRQNDTSRMQLQQRTDFPAPSPLVSSYTPMRDQVTRLHNTYGNQAVLRMLSRSTPAIQTKLTVNQPGDEFEQEANRVADHVMSMSAPPAVQRKCSSCEEEEKLQRKCTGCGEEEQRKIQHKETNAGPEVVPPIVDDVLRSRGQPLNPGLREFMEPRFGYDFSHVRVHTDAKAAESARSVSALAYTVDSNIVFAEGQYAPTGNQGRGLIAHELTHVIQQTAGHSSARAGSPSAFQRNAPVQMRTRSGAVQRDKPAATSASLTVRFNEPKSPDDKLTFPPKQTCSQDLGLHECTAVKRWVWNVEIEGDVSDDATQWTTSQSFTGKRKGVVKTTDGQSVPFDSPLNVPNDSPESDYIQQKAGQKKLFWVDAPGHEFNLDNDKFDSVTQVQNFTSKICSKSDAKTCSEVKWFLKLVVTPGQKLDTKATKAGLGSEPTTF